MLGTLWPTSFWSLLHCLSFVLTPLRLIHLSNKQICVLFMTLSLSLYAPAHRQSGLFATRFNGERERYSFVEWHFQPISSAFIALNICMHIFFYFILHSPMAAGRARCSEADGRSRWREKRVGLCR